MKPTFLFIGVQKSGSTSFIRYMNAHPDIYCHDSEIHYFDPYVKLEYNEDDHTNYEKKFKTNKKVIGEKTPSYMIDRLTIDRISEYDPSMKLIIFLREPIQRAYSQFNMNQLYKRKEHRGGNDHFTKKIKEQTGLSEFHPRGGIIQRGYYYEQITYLYSKFPKENVHIRISEENKEDILNCYNEIFDFLGVKRLDFPDIEHVSDARIGKYKEPLNGLNKKLLYKIYKPHNKKLYELLGRSIGAWERYYDNFI